MPRSIAARRLRRPLAEKTPAPSSTAPMRAATSPRLRTSPRAPHARSAGIETSSPPAVCGSYASASRAARRAGSRRAARRTRGCVGRRPSALPPPRARARREERERLRVDHDAHAAPRRELVRVPQQPEAGHVRHRVRLERPDRVRSRPVELDHRLDGRFERARRARFRPAAPGARSPCRAASSGRGRRPDAPRLRPDPRPDAPCRRRRARTSAPCRGSCGRPQESRRLHGRARRRRPAPRRAPRPGAPPGKAATESASSGAPPIANTSFSAFVAAIAPNVRGSSTSGGKKSTVNTIARSSSRRYTAASSAGSRPTSRSSASAGTSPARSVSSRAAEYFAAQPPARASDRETLTGLHVEHCTRKENARRWPEHRCRRDPSPSPLPLTQRPPPPRRPHFFAGGKRCFPRGPLPLRCTGVPLWPTGE